MWGWEIRGVAEGGTRGERQRERGRGRGRGREGRRNAKEEMEEKEKKGRASGEVKTFCLWPARGHRPAQVTDHPRVTPFCLRSPFVTVATISVYGTEPPEVYRTAECYVQYSRTPVELDPDGSRFAIRPD